MKDRDRREFFDEMVDFPIGKWHFWVRGWSGAVWELLEKKKDKTKCSYKSNTLLRRSNLKTLQKLDKVFAERWKCTFFINFIVFRADLDEN